MIDTDQAGAARSSAWSSAPERCSYCTGQCIFFSCFDRVRTFLYELPRAAYVVCGGRMSACWKHAVIYLFEAVLDAFIVHLVGIEPTLENLPHHP